MVWLLVVIPTVLMLVILALQTLYVSDLEKSLKREQDYALKMIEAYASEFLKRVKLEDKLSRLEDALDDDD